MEPLCSTSNPLRGNARNSIIWLERGLNVSRRANKADLFGHQQSGPTVNNVLDGEERPGHAKFARRTEQNGP